ncbi:MAG: glutaredoxin family protein [Deltaproteobacteria bacterium]|nr:glutaredoxin family protein [Deltaproteobacteria bacterium]
MLRVAAVASLVVCAIAFGAAVMTADEAPDIVVFARPGCSRCADAERFLAELRREQPTLRIESHDVLREPAARERLRALTTRRGVRTLVVPAFLIGDELVLGFRADVSERELRSRLAAMAERMRVRKTPTPARMTTRPSEAP